MNKTLTEAQINRRWVEILIEILSLEKPTTIGPRDASCFVSALQAILAAQQPEPVASITDDQRDKIEQAEACLRNTGRKEDREAANDLLDVLIAHPVQPEPRVEVTDSDIAKLKRFAGLVLKDHRNGGYPGDVDGGELQAYAEQCGLIEERRVESPCGENCSCTDFGEFPTTCYFNTDLGKAVIDAARAGDAS